VGISSALPLALASSVLPKLRPLTRLAVRSARVRIRAGSAAFPCSAVLTGWFRSALYTGSAGVRVQGAWKPRSPTACPFGPSLNQSLVACWHLRCLRAFIWFWPCHPIL